MTDFHPSTSLCVLLSDKEGCFVGVPKGMFYNKATAIVQNENARHVWEQPAKVKERAINLLQQLNIVNVASEAKSEKNITLEVFFTLKTNKQEVSFLTIASARDA